MIQLTEEEFKELEEFFNCWKYCLDRWQKARDKGWIKKTAIEEARELTEDLLNRQMMSPSIKVIILDVRNAYEEVISELQDKLKM